MAAVVPHQASRRDKTGFRWFCPSKAVCHLSVYTCTLTLPNTHPHTQTMLERYWDVTSALLQASNIGTATFPPSSYQIHRLEISLFFHDGIHPFSTSSPLHSFSTSYGLFFHFDHFPCVCKGVSHTHQLEIYITIVCLVSSHKYMHTDMRA